MSFWLCALGLLAAAYPLGRAGRANRRTTLRQATLWAACAGAAWVLRFVTAALELGPEVAFARHLALCLTGCAGCWRCCCCRWRRGGGARGWSRPT